MAEARCWSGRWRGVCKDAKGEELYKLYSLFLLIDYRNAYLWNILWSNFLLDLISLHFFKFSNWAFSNHLWRHKFCQFKLWKSIQKWLENKKRRLTSSWEIISYNNYFILFEGLKFVLSQKVILKRILYELCYRKNGTSLMSWKAFSILYSIK